MLFTGCNKDYTDDRSVNKYLIETYTHIHIIEYTKFTLAFYTSCMIQTMIVSPMETVFQFRVTMMLLKSLGMSIGSNE